MSVQACHDVALVFVCIALELAQQSAGPSGYWRMRIEASVRHAISQAAREHFDGLQDIARPGPRLFLVVTHSDQQIQKLSLGWLTA